MTLSGGQHICKKVGGRNKKRVSSKTITQIYVNIANAIFLETVYSVENITHLLHILPRTDTMGV